jgi:tRNA dimethylallyltransferase
MKVTFVMGPTASGKSDFALTLAAERQGVIINCDSVQGYAHLQIGAAKPSPADLEKVPHYLYGHVQPPREYTAGKYCRDFFVQVKELEIQGVEEIFVVGGTGFYFQAIEKGMYTVAKAEPELAEGLRLQASTKQGLEDLYNELKLFDPASIEKSIDQVAISTGDRSSRKAAAFGSGAAFSPTEKATIATTACGTRWRPARIIRSASCSKAAETTCTARSFRA